MIEERFESMLQEVANGELVAGTLSSPVKSDVLKMGIRPVMVKGTLMYQVSRYYSQKVMHENIPCSSSVNFIKTALQEYRQAVFTTQSAGYHLNVGKDGTLSIKKKSLASSKPLPVLSHNISKKYILPEGVPVPFLVHLGVMTVDGKVVAKKYDKFRQVNRFLEMVRDIIAHLPRDRTVKIVDFGCGKAYLTFALHYYLHEIEHFDVDIVGLDLKDDVVAHCNDVVRQLNIKGVKFTVADIGTYNYNGSIDLMISLHACDTATDAALAKAVKWQAKVILCVPCCQHELYKQIKSDTLASLLHHGILRERFAALATDAARAELLEIQGYDVQVLEFIDMEHTPKNLLIRAVKGTSAKSKRASERFTRMKDELHVDVALERFLEE